MGASKTHKSAAKSASSHTSSSGRKREQDKEVAAEPSASAAATYGSSFAGESDATLGRSDDGDDQFPSTYDEVLAQAKAEDTKQFVSEAAKAQEIRARYWEDPKEAKARHKQEIKQALRDSGRAKGNKGKRDGQPSSSRQSEQKQGKHQTGWHHRQSTP